MDRHEKSWLSVGLLILAVPLLVLTAALTLRIHGGARLSRAQARFIDEVGSLDPASYVAADLPEQENAAKWLTAGAEALELSPDDLRFVGRLSNAATDRWSDDQAAELRALIERSAAALALLHGSRPLERSSYEIAYGGDGGERLPPVRELVRASQLLELQGRLALREGRTGEAIESFETLGRLAGSLEREPYFLLLRYGMGAERRQLALVRELLEARVPEASTIDRLQQGLVSVDPLEAYRTALAAETARFMPFVTGSAPPVAGHAWTAVMGPLAGARLLEAVRSRAAALDRSFPEARAALEESDRGLDITMIDKLYRPDDGQLGGLAFRGASMRRLARIALRMSRQAAMKGAYPRDLGGYRASGPDPFTGEPLALELFDDGGALLFAPGVERSLEQLGEKRGPGLHAWRLAPPAGLSRDPA
jgi:hypothetical protein